MKDGVTDANMLAHDNTCTLSSELRALLMGNNDPVSL